MTTIDTLERSEYLLLIQQAKKSPLAMQRLSELAISKNPEPESFEPHADGKFSFAFLPYDSHVVCRIDCDAISAEGARAQALNWLKLSYWNDDGTSVIPEPIFWSTLVKPDGSKVGKIL